MIIIPIPEPNFQVTNPSELNSLLTYFELATLRDLEGQERPLDFRMVENLDRLKELEGSINTKKRIYKSGFLFEFYSILYPKKKKGDLYNIINDKYHLFINQRQFQRDVKSYNDKKVSIFVE